MDTGATLPRGKFFDRDPARALCARWNTDLYGVGSRVCVVVADVLKINEFQGLVHVDPDQRAGGHARSHRIEDAVPGRDYLDALTVQAEGGAIKLSPAANFLGKFAGCEIELVTRLTKQRFVSFASPCDSLTQTKLNYLLC